MVLLALAADRASRVRLEIALRSASATAGRMWAVNSLRAGLSVLTNWTAVCHQPGDECDIASESVEMGNQQFGIVDSTGSQCLPETLAVVPFAGLAVLVLGKKSVIAAKEPLDGGPLGVQVQSAATLIPRAHPEIRNVPHVATHSTVVR
nr:hypothetical protein [Azospirillum argentinense]